MPGSKNPERRCTATVRSTGERCKRAAIKGGFVCTSHGGASPQVRKKARERLIDLVDPALGALHKVLSDPDADDSVKVRAALGVLDRTGHGPGTKIEVEVSTWERTLQAAVMANGGQLDFDRESLGALPAGQDDEDREQHAIDARTEAWRELDREDAEPYTTKLDPFDGRTVRGEVVDSRDEPGPFPPDAARGPGEYGG